MNTHSNTLTCAKCGRQTKGQARSSSTQQLRCSSCGEHLVSVLPCSDDPRNDQCDPHSAHGGWVLLRAHLPGFLASGILLLLANYLVAIVARRYSPYLAFAGGGLTWFALVGLVLPQSVIGLLRSEPPQPEKRVHVVLFLAWLFSSFLVGGFMLWLFSGRPIIR